jgi:hypothetical protein
MAVIGIGDRVRYKGAKGSVFGREGLVRFSYQAHSHRMLEVDFGTEVYPCWEGNLELVEEEIHISVFPPEEVTTARATRPPSK